MNPPLESAIIVTNTQNAPVAVESRTEVDESLVEDDLLVEEVSIDGMCGVY
ncbi:mycofactocin precursor MftA [Dactylosporangium sp. AC04546]|uniref:mycofactocin precursor MftA n=1 Tax=Dactylosporangium sp. AC04546 TaxID=2862460 RepID=UPI001EDF34E8|nr:mycofactocin precursor MftA [Dactylosporangium sp. AC04546]WVK86432.1 mycofactocin precursor MftA [Dactylosporangium sp. AC04546]